MTTPPSGPGQQPPHSPPPGGTPPGGNPPTGGYPPGGGNPPPGGNPPGGNPPPGGYPPPGGNPSPLDAKGFFAALVDWRFHTMITPKIVSIVYLAGMILITLIWLGLLIQGFALEPVFGVLVLLFGPIVAVVYLAFWRMTLEFYFAIVRMSDDIHRSSTAPRA